MTKPKISLFVCPVCGQVLERGEKTYRCGSGHCYDIAAEGYTYLLPVSRKHSLTPGDDREMAAARRAFLAKGHFGVLLDALCGLSLKYTGSRPAVLDAGCGEGYYTEGVIRALSDAGRAPEAAAIDISKYSLRYAAKNRSGIEFAVASSYRLPLRDESIDLLVNCFSPLALDEFRRVLKPGGVFIYVVPGARHLWELKQVLYDTPYPNAEKETPYEGFSYLEIADAGTDMVLDSAEDIQDLLRMTPYFWKTPKDGKERLNGMSALTVSARFKIHVFRKQ